MSERRTLRVTLEIAVADLPAKVMRELYNESPDFMPAPDIMRKMNEEATASEVADVLRDGALKEIGQELFAGSDLYLEFGDVKVTKAEWVEPTGITP